MRTIWINAGELSGDMQAAALLDALHEQEPDLVAVGMGGPNLARAGQKTLLRVEALSVMGIAEIFTVIPRAVRMLCRIRKELSRLRPDAVVLVDAPEFNFQVAKIAHRLGIPVYYFIPPKVWAWRTSRVRFLKKYVRRLFCILPFEPDFYAQHGILVDYAGNPLVDMVNWPAIAKIKPVPGRIGLMPGSRRKEVAALMPVFADAARLLLRQGRDVTFHCLRAPNMTEEHLRALWPADIPVVFEAPEDRYATMRGCTCILAASGTATLETALADVPTLVTYRVAPFSALIGRWLIRVPWVSLPNLILHREVFPELLQEHATGENIAHTLSRWLDDPARLDVIHTDLAELRQRCGAPGSAKRAATCVLAALDQI
ncbi:MAG: lipid-A-disaccharide synthase [Bilophila sp.]